MKSAPPRTSLETLIKNKEPPVIDTKEPKTFIELYKYLQKCDYDNIREWLKEPWIGKDKQESLLRLFAGLVLIDKLKSYDICKGNFNNKTITKNTTIKDVFYNQEDNLINLKDKGDSSDLTGICKKNEKHLLVSTSKNLNKTQVGRLDIDKILTNFKQYENNGYTMSLCICVRDRNEFKNMKKNIEKTNHVLKSLLENEDTIIIDWNDLNEAYHKFKWSYGPMPIDNIINSNKTPLCLRMHQRIGVLKTLRMKNSEKKKILLGHIQRSGKSYIIAGCIIEDSKNKNECNYLVITTAPNETTLQQRKVFDCIQLIEFNIIVLNGKNKKPDLTKKNIIICSKQFLQTKIDKGHDKTKHSEEKTKSIAWLKKMSFDMRFIDESHNGGTTELAKKTLEYYGNEAFTIHITATFSKPINDYNIPKNCRILWDLEDIKLCKNIKDEFSIIRLAEKHGNDIKDIISKYSKDDIISEYSKYPELWILTREINPNYKTEIIKKTRENYYGWSSDACFILNQGIEKDKKTQETKLLTKSIFQNETENLKPWYTFFGKKDKYGIPDKDYPDNIVFMKRIEKICKDSTINSRFIGEGDFRNEPMIIMAFLPVYTDRGKGNLKKISDATINLLIDYNVCPEYIIISINDNGKGKTDIEDARIEAKKCGKKGVLVLTGTKCSLGVSIKNCDIVILLNNNNGFDIISQMMFRCMTEGKNKKCAFVVDFNIHRSINSLINYASFIKPNIHPKKAIKFILQERLINLNGDHWMPSFGNNNLKIDTLCKNVYELYSSNTKSALNHLLNRFSYDKIVLTKEEQQIFNDIFINTILTKKLIKIYKKEQIKKGIEKKKIDIEEKNKSSNSIKNDEKQVNCMNILKHIIPLLCILTIRDKESTFEKMFNYINNNKKLYDIFIGQIKNWWGEIIDKKILKRLFSIYIKYMKDDKEKIQIIRSVKELFRENINNSKELSFLIDKYLIPQELEKKKNAEVSTPYKLRQEMLNKIPEHFWTSTKKVFEPCSGKGGFIVDIINKFMNGLKEIIPDEKERYKIIVEKCLYFSDINPTNIFICKLLIDPDNKYKLNCNKGNTLELDIKKKWDINGFDAVIGNPPYQSQIGTGDNKLYLDFTKYSIDNLYKKGILLFITPTTIIDYIIEMNKNRKYINILYDIKYIALNTPQKYFNVNSTFTYFMLKKQIYQGNTIIEHYKGKNKIHLKKGMVLPKIPSKNHLKIINKICSKCNCYNVKKFKFSDKAQRIRKNHIEKKIVSKHKTKTHKYKIYDTKNKTNPNGIYYYYDKLDNEIGKKRIIFSNKGYLLPFITDSKDETYSDNFSYILYENNILKLFKSKIVDYLIYQFSKNGFDRIKCIKMIKKVKLKDNIYKSFNLTDEEIKIIKNINLVKISKITS